MPKCRVSRSFVLDFDFLSMRAEVAGETFANSGEAGAEIAELADFVEFGELVCIDVAAVRPNFVSILKLIKFTVLGLVSVGVGAAGSFIFPREEYERLLFRFRDLREGEDAEERALELDVETLALAVLCIACCGASFSSCVTGSGERFACSVGSGCDGCEAVWDCCCACAVWRICGENFSEIERFKKDRFLATLSSGASELSGACEPFNLCVSADL